MDNNKKEILVQRIEPYMERFVKFFKVGHIKLKEAELKELAELMKMINPRYNFRWKLNCNSCIRDVIVALSNFYDRESKYVPKTDNSPSNEPKTTDKEYEPEVEEDLSNLEEELGNLIEEEEEE